MNYIIVTLQRDNQAEDIKIPAFMPVRELMEIFSELYGIECASLHAEPKGIILDKNKTLEEQGVLYGAKLTIA